MYDLDYLIDELNSIMKLTVPNPMISRASWGVKDIISIAKMGKQEGDLEAAQMLFDDILTEAERLIGELDDLRAVITAHRDAFSNAQRLAESAGVYAQRLLEKEL